MNHRLVFGLKARNPKAQGKRSAALGGRTQIKDLFKAQGAAAMNNLRECYDAVAAQTGSLDEPFEVVEAVEQLRQFWRPPEVRIVLLAESHVFTTLTELGLVLKPDLLPPSYPNQFVRFVYCLGCGESKLLQAPLEMKNGGTPQFWSVLQSCQHEIDFKELTKSGNSDFENRVRAKVQLLEKLKESGIWLVDASITALYDRGSRPTPQRVTDVLRVCWDTYVGEVIQRAKPDGMLIIGKGVYRALAERIKQTGIRHDVVEQPNARLSGDQRAKMLARIAEFCAET